MATAQAESELSERALAGERAAWDLLISRHRRRVVVVLMGDGLSLSEADEVCQEAWGRLWEQQQRGALTRLELPGLAVTQARFIARDRARHGRVVSTLQVLPGGDQVESVDEGAMTRQTLERLARRLEQLPAQQQRIFRLAQHDGVPHADIAAQVGLSLQRVRQIIFEVRTKLRAELEVA